METRIAVALALGLQLAATAGAAAQGADPKKPAAAPSAAVSNSVVAQEQLIYDAIARKDTVAFNKAVGRDFVYVDENGAMRWSLAKTSTIFAECGLGTGWTIDQPRGRSGVSRERGEKEDRLRRCLARVPRVAVGASAPPDDRADADDDQPARGHRAAGALQVRDR